MARRGFLWTACAVAVALLAGVLIAYAPYGRDATPQAHAGAAAVAGPRELARTLRFQGRIDRSQEVEFFSEFSGMIEEVKVAYGQEVARGALLARFSTRELEMEIARLAAERETAGRWLAEHYPAARRLLEQAIAAAAGEAESAAAEARATAAAYERGVKEGIASPDERDAAQAAARKPAAEAQRRLQERRLELNALERQRAQTQASARIAAEQLEARTSARGRQALKAPFDGTVTGLSEALRAPSGKPVAQGQYLLTLTNLEDSVVQLAIDARELRYFARAGGVRCVVQRTQAAAPCEVQSAQRSDPGKANAAGYVVRLQIGAGAGQIGDVVSVSLPLETKSVPVAVPATALRSEGEREHVVVLRQGRQVPQPVLVGFRGDSAVEIVNGLQAGDSVLLR